MATKKFLTGMLALALVFGMTVVGCDDGIVDAQDWYTPQPPVLQPPRNPIDRIESINLGTMTSSASGWRELLNSISNEGKFVNLDLSDCTMTGTSFNPDATVTTGKGYIVSIILPDTATSIEEGTSSRPTFLNFGNLESISGANINTIGDYSFYCAFDYLLSSLLGTADPSWLINADFPNAVTIGASAFSRTILRNINFPLVTTIGNSAFSSCTSLTNATFPLVESIGVDAFSQCSNLQSIKFPASAELGRSSDTYSNPFTDCGKLIFTLIDSGTGSLSVIENGKVLVRNSTILLAYPSASGNVTMNNITALDGKVFYSRSQLTSINLPAVTSIGSSAFTNCSNLQDVNFPQATSIGSSVFSGCSRLQSATLPLVTTISSDAFRNCSNLLSLDIPKVTRIESWAFYSTGGTALTITMGSSAPTLVYRIFYEVTTAKTVRVKVPSGTTSYSPFNGSTTTTVSGTNTGQNWANGFRGGGWSGGTWYSGSQYITSGPDYINQNITVIIEQQ